MRGRRRDREPNRKRHRTGFWVYGQRLLGVFVDAMGVVTKPPHPPLLPPPTEESTEGVLVSGGVMGRYSAILRYD